MKKMRILFCGMLAVTAVFMFVFGSKFLLAILITEIIMISLIYFILKFETSHVEVSMEIRSGCKVKNETPMIFEVTRKRPVIVGGNILITMEYYNVLMQSRQTVEIALPLINGQTKYEIPFRASVCGTEHLICKRVVYTDLLHILSTELPNMREKMIVVYPEDVKLEVVQTTSISSFHDGDQFDYNKKGNDPLEVYDMKDYQPGDDVRSIHWKLSTKLDRLIMRESSDSTHYDTIIMFDVGRSVDGQLLDEELITTAYGFLKILSEKMLENSVPHHIGTPLADRLRLTQVTTFQQLEGWIDEGMGLALSKENGTGLNQFLIQRLDKDYTKIIYVTNGAFPKIFYELGEQIAISGICITESGKEVAYTDKGKSQMMELPMNILYEQTQYISM